MRQDSDEKLNGNSYGHRVQKHIYATTTNFNEVAFLHDLEEGHYLIIPCTGKPGIDMKFLLRVFTDIEISSRYFHISLSLC